MISTPINQILDDENQIIKPVKAKPVFYACCYEYLKTIARDMGYNLLVNGSLNRDMDLVAIPWSDNPSEMKDVVIAFDKYLRGIHYTEKDIESGYLYKVLPGGRHAFVVNLNRGGKWNQYLDEQWYLDISFTPSPTQIDNWIPVEYRLPNEMDSVLVIITNGTVQPSTFENGKFSRFRNNTVGDRTVSYFYDPVTHWQPFPSQPK